MDLLDIIFPINCLECGKKGRYLCGLCLAKAGRARLFCLECHKPSTNGITHPRCRKKYSIDFAYSPWDYGGVVRKAILKLKYNYAYMIAEELAEGLVKKIESGTPTLPTNALLIPIPLNRLRQNWRGFNQAERVGKLISERFGWCYNPNLLVRIRKTAPQTELKGVKRTKNILGAFSVIPKSKIYNSTYILFDDVLTTGSTLKEACKVLKRRGVKVVCGLTIAA